MIEQIKIIDKNKGLVEFLPSFINHCPNHPKQYSFTEIDILKVNFCRYTKRTMYYAELFTNSFNKINTDLKCKYENRDKEFFTIIPDDIFFDFDAFIFSCKSIVDSNNKKSKTFFRTCK